MKMNEFFSSKREPIQQLADPSKSVESGQQIIMQNNGGR
jgi:hypothetical protein